MDSVSDYKNAIDLYKKLSTLWKSAGMHASEWLSNSEECLWEIPAAKRKTCSSYECIHLEMCTDVRPNKAQFPEKNNHIFRAFGIFDAIYHWCKGFVPRNLDHRQRIVRSRFS